MTVNDTRDFGIGKRLENLPALGQVGFAADRLLRVQRTSHDPWHGEEAFAASPHRLSSTVNEHRLRFADRRVHALLGALVVFRLLPNGFATAICGSTSPPC